MIGEKRFRKIGDESGRPLRKKPRVEENCSSHNATASLEENNSSRNSGGFASCSQASIGSLCCPQQATVSAEMGSTSNDHQWKNDGPDLDTTETDRKQEIRRSRQEDDFDTPFASLPTGISPTERFIHASKSEFLTSTAAECLTSTESSVCDFDRSFQNWKLPPRDAMRRPNSARAKCFAIVALVLFLGIVCVVLAVCLTTIEHRQRRNVPHRETRSSPSLHSLDASLGTFSLVLREASDEVKVMQEELSHVRQKLHRKIQLQRIQTQRTEFLLKVREALLHSSQLETRKFRRGLSDAGKEFNVLSGERQLWKDRLSLNQEQMSDLEFRLGQCRQDVFELVMKAGMAEGELFRWKDESVTRQLATEKMGSRLMAVTTEMDRTKLVLDKALLSGSDARTRLHGAERRINLLEDELKVLMAVSIEAVNSVAATSIRTQVAQAQGVVNSILETTIRQEH